MAEFHSHANHPHAFSAPSPSCRYLLKIAIHLSCAGTIWHWRAVLGPIPLLSFGRRRALSNRNRRSAGLSFCLSRLLCKATSRFKWTSIGAGLGQLATHASDLGGAADAVRFACAM